MTHLSALGANAKSASAYARTKAEGENAVRAVLPDTVILRPSIIFGQDDSFFNRFANMARFALPAGDRRRRNKTPAGLCRRRGGSRRARRRRQADAGHHL